MRPWTRPASRSKWLLDCSTQKGLAICPNASASHPISRRFPDPLGGHRHFLLVRAKDVPQGIPKDPNPRDQNINRLVYKDVYKSLLNEECEPDTFHLKNKGITLVASAVRKIRDNDDINIYFEEGQGIVDGAHTYEIVLKGQESGHLSEDQYVKLEVLVGVPENLIPEIAGGLNTAVQVQTMSLANLEGDFNWIKTSLRGEPYESAVAYQENQSDKHLDVRDVIAYMALFNIELYANDKSDYPINAYRSKQATLRSFLNNRPSFMKLSKILPDILELADLVSFEAAELHNETGGKAGALSFIESRKKDFYFPIIDCSGRYRLSGGALFPMLGAFRWMVTEGPDGNFKWRTLFKDVKRLWKRVGAELISSTQATSRELGRNPNAIGKSRNHWATLHSAVVKQQLMASAGK